MSPKTGRSRGRAWSSIWSMPCSILRATARISSGSCAPIKTVSARPTKIGVFEMGEAGLVRSPKPLGSVSRRAGRSFLRGRRLCRPRRHTARAHRDPSPCRPPPLSARRAALLSAGIVGGLAMVLAVLEARCGVSFAGKDVYLNVAGGLRINEPAADLAVAAAIASSAFDVPLAA